MLVAFPCSEELEFGSCSHFSIKSTLENTSLSTAYLVLNKALNRLLSGSAWLSHLIGEQRPGGVSVTDD